MEILLRSLNTGIIYALLTLSFYICATKLKFINFAIGSCFYLAGLFLIIFDNSSLSFFPLLLFAFFFCITLGICDILLINQGIDKNLANIIVLGIGSIFIDYVAQDSNITNSIILDYNFNSSILFFILITLSIISFFITYKLITNKSSLFSNILTIIFSNCLASCAGFLYVINKNTVIHDYISPIVISALIYFLSRFFLGNFKRFCTMFSLFITSSIIVSEMQYILNLYDFSYINIMYIFIILTIILGFYLKSYFLEFSIFDDPYILIQKTNTLNKNSKQISVNIDFINAVKSQYV